MSAIFGDDNPPAPIIQMPQAASAFTCVFDALWRAEMGRRAMGRSSTSALAEGRRGGYGGVLVGLSSVASAQTPEEC
jgi:hypothetical protein